MSNPQKESIPAGILNIAPTVWYRCWPLPWSETPVTNVNRLSSCPTHFQSWKLQQETNSLVSQKAWGRTAQKSSLAAVFQPTVVFQKMKNQMSSPNVDPTEDSKTTVSPSKKRRPSSEQPWGSALPLPWPVAAGCGHGITHGTQPTQCPHVQENEVGSLQLRSLKTRRPNM